MIVVCHSFGVSDKHVSDALGLDIRMIRRTRELGQVQLRARWMETAVKFRRLRLARATTRGQ
jgi:hypothetical protein